MGWCGVGGLAWAVRGRMGKGTRLLGTVGGGGAGGASPSRAVTRSRLVAIRLCTRVPSAVRTVGGAVMCPSEPHCRSCDWLFFLLYPSTVGGVPTGGWRVGGVGGGVWRLAPVFSFLCFFSFFFFSLFALLFLPSTVYLFARRDEP